MVYDFEEGRILGEITDLEEEIRVIDSILNYVTVNDLEGRKKQLERTLDRLKSLKGHLDRLLHLRRQRVKDSGIKY